MEKISEVKDDLIKKVDKIEEEAKDEVTKTEKFFREVWNVVTHFVFGIALILLVIGSILVGSGDKTIKYGWLYGLFAVFLSLSMFKVTSTPTAQRVCLILSALAVIVLVILLGFTVFNVLAIIFEAIMLVSIKNPLTIFKTA